MERFKTISKAGFLTNVTIRGDKRHVFFVTIPDIYFVFVRNDPKTAPLTFYFLGQCNRPPKGFIKSLQGIYFFRSSTPAHPVSVPLVVCISGLRIRLQATAVGMLMLPAACARIPGTLVPV